MTLRFLSRAFILVAALLPVGACKLQFPDRGDTNYVVGLRLLDIKAEPPEVAAGQMTTLSALAIDTMGRPIDLSWSYCDGPASGFGGVNDDCVTNDSSSFLHDVGSGMSLMMTMPTVDPAILGNADQTGGVYLPIRVKAVAGTDVQKAIYHLRVNMGGTANQNPALSGVYQVMAGAGTPSDGGTMMDGGTISQGTDLLTPIDPATPLPVHSGDKMTLRALFTMASTESYMVQGRPNDSGMSMPRTVNERLDVTFYSTAGTFSDPPRAMTDGGMGMGGMFGRTSSDQILTLDNNLPAAGSNIDVWVVGRDNRGGSDYQHRTLQLQ